MKIQTGKSDETGKTETEEAKMGTPASLRSLKNFFSNKLHHAAEGLAEKALAPDTPPGMAHYGQQASEWLDQSAQIVHEFDGKQATVQVREMITENPGRSLLIAGAIGLIIGILIRRR